MPTPQIAELSEQVMPPARDVRHVKVDPRNGSVFYAYVRVMAEAEWATLPSYERQNWDVTHYGATVVATRVDF